MILLVLGVLLWCGLHLMKTVTPGMRGALIDQLGEKRHKVAIAVGIGLSILLMIFGWRATVPTFVYQPPLWGAHLAPVLVLVAFLFIQASHGSTRIKRVLRHPMLTGFALWALAHLLANGDVRSVILFGGLGAWALLEVVLINRREGVWVRPEPGPWSAELKHLAIGVGIYLVVLIVHPYLFGVSPLPY
ncbi:MAG: NnrU family protein [Geminicoccaceae bacterium]